MSTNIGDLEGTISLVDDFSSTFAKFGAGALGMNAQLELIKKGFAGLDRVADALAGPTKAMLALSDQLSNLSGRTGIGVEALQKLAFAGAAVGVSMESIALGMQRFQRSLVAGNESTIESLKKLGLTREALANMLPEKQLSTILSALNEKIPNAANRTQIAMQLLGRGGAAFIPLGADIESVMKKAEELGTVMSEADIAAADALGDSLGELEMAFGGVVNNIGSVITNNKALAEIIEFAKEQVGEFSKFIHDNRDEMGEWVTSGLMLAIDGIDLMLEAVDGLVDVWGLLSPVIKAAGEVLLTAADVVNVATGGLVDMRTALDNVKLGWDALRLTWLSAKNVAGDLALVQLKLSLANAEFQLSGQSPAGKMSANVEAQLKAQIESHKLNIDMLEKTKAAWSEEGNAIVAGTEAVKDRSGATEALHLKLDKLRTKLADVAKGHDVAGAAGETHKKVMLELAKGVETAEQKFARLAKEMLRISQEAEDFELKQELDESAMSAKLLEEELIKDRKAFEEVEKAALGASMAAEAWLLGTSKEGFDQNAKENEDIRTRMGADVKKEDADKIRKAADESRRWAGALAEVGNILQDIGKSLGGIAGGMVGLAGAASGTAGALMNYNAQIKANKEKGINGLTAGQKVQGGAAAAGTAVDIWQSNKQNLSKGGAAMDGAGKGAQAGAAFGPYGIVIGAAVGALVGVLSGSGFRKMAKEASKILGVEMTAELAKAIDNTRKALKVDTKTASLLNISTAIESSGKSASGFVPQITDLITGIADKSIPAKEGMEQLSKSFALVAEEASKSKFASIAMFNVMKEARASKVLTDNMKEAISAMTAEMGQFSNVAFGTFHDIKLDDGSTTQSAVGSGIDILKPESAVAQATIFGIVWGQTVAEKGLVEAARILEPGFRALQDKLAQHGEKFLTAANAVFAPIAQQFALATNEMFAGAADSAVAFGGILKDAINSGLPLTIEQFKAFGTVAQDAFDQATAAALELGMTTEDAQKQALMAIAPLLQQLVQGSEAYGFNLDEATLKLIEQAKAAGIAFAASPIDRVAAAMDRVVTAVEKLAGITHTAADEALRLSNNLGGITPPTGGSGGGDGGGGDGGGKPDRNGDLPGYAGGTDGFVNFGQGTPVMLHNWEAVIPKDDAGLIGGMTVQNSPTFVFEGDMNDRDAVISWVGEAVRNNEDQLTSRITDAMRRGI